MILNEVHHNGKFCLNCGSPLFGKQEKFCTKPCNREYHRHDYHKKKRGIYDEDKSKCLEIGKGQLFWGLRRIKTGPDPKCVLCHIDIGEYDNCLEFPLFTKKSRQNTGSFYFCEQCTKKLKSQLN